MYRRTDLVLLTPSPGTGRGDDGLCEMWRDISWPGEIDDGAHGRTTDLSSRQSNFWKLKKSLYNEHRLRKSPYLLLLRSPRNEKIKAIRIEFSLAGGGL